MFCSFQALRLIDLSVNSADDTTGKKVLLIQKPFDDLWKESLSKFSKVSEAFLNPIKHIRLTSMKTVNG